MRTAYQIYKEAVPNGNITAFNGLSMDEMLPYRVEAAEEALQEHVEYLEGHPEERPKYAVSCLHTAVAYVSQIATYFPLMSRNTNAKKICIQFRLLNAVVRMLQLNTNIAQNVAAAASTSTLTLKDLGALESCLSDEENRLRAAAKESGSRIEMLRHPIKTSATVAGGSSSSAGDTKGVAPSLEPTASLAVPDEASSALMKEDGAASAKNRRVRRRSSGEAPPAQRVKKEADGADAPLSQSRNPASTPKTKIGATTSPGAGGTTLATCGRLRPLTTQEKKLAVELRQLIQLLAHVVAVKFNELILIFDFLMERVKVLESIAATATKGQKTSMEGPPPLDVSFAAVREAIAESNRTFREDENCREEFDEDLLHPISYALLVELNRLEGFLSPPFLEPSEEDKKKKRAAREVLKQKRDELRHKAEEKKRQKDALNAERDKEMTMLRRLVGSADEVWTDEQTEFKDQKQVQQLPYVHYKDIHPYENVGLFQKALFLWTMITSLPKILQLSKMSFQTFTHGLFLDSDLDNGLMIEICHQLVEVAKDQAHGATTKSYGKPWFQSLVEFVATASGNRTKRPSARKASSSESRESSGSELDEEGEEDEANQTAEEKEVEEVKRDPAATFEEELRRTVERMTELHSRASWGNSSVEDRLNLLRFCVMEILSSDSVREEADVLQRENEEAIGALEKGMRDIRDDAEKELRRLWKASNSAADGGGSQKEEIEQVLKQVQTKRCELYGTWVKKQDNESEGCILEPIGTDRFRRLYWRMPLDNRILVQTTPETPPVPAVPPPPLLASSSKKLILEDEEDEPNAAPPQTMWGEVSPQFLDVFIQGLDANGKHEGPLRRVLECMSPQLKKNATFTPAAARMTRSRHNMCGYSNQFKQLSFF